MIIVTEGYSIYNEWSDISIQKALNVAKLKMPDRLNQVCQALFNPDSTEEDKLKEVSEIYKGCTDKELKETFPAYYKDVIYQLSNIPRIKVDALDYTNSSWFFNEYLLSVVYGIKHQDFSDVKGIEFFEYGKKKYYLPKHKEILGQIRPFDNVTALEFAEASDIDKNSKKLDGGLWEHATLVIALLCRPKGVSYSEDDAIKLSKEFLNLPSTVVWELYYQLYATHEHIRTLYPRMFSKGTAPVVAKEIDKLGWRASIHAMAGSYLKIKEVEQSNMWDFLERINYERIK